MYFTEGISYFVTDYNGSIIFSTLDLDVASGSVVTVFEHPNSLLASSFNLCYSYFQTVFSIYYIHFIFYFFFSYCRIPTLLCTILIFLIINSLAKISPFLTTQACCFSPFAVRTFTCHKCCSFFLSFFLLFSPIIYLTIVHSHYF